MGNEWAENTLFYYLGNKIYYVDMTSIETSPLLL